MKRIFRSILDVRKNNKSTIEQSELIINYRSFLRSKVQPEDPSHIKIYHWIEAHFRDYGEIPSADLLYSRAMKEGDEVVLASLKDIVIETPFIRSDYKEILKQKQEEQNKDKLHVVLQKVWNIANEGIKVGKKEVRGLSSAVEYFVSETRNFRLANLVTKTESDIRSEEDSKELILESRERRKNPQGTLGMYTTLEKIDVVCKGLKPGELMIIAAFVAQGKSTLCANLVYNGVYQGLNGLFVPLEMSFEEMRTMFYVLHSASAEWLEKAPKYKDLIGKISYDKVIYGELTDYEQEFFEVVINDFKNQEDYGSLFIYQPTESEGFTPSKLETIAYDYNAKLKDKGKTLDFIAVDYIGLMNPDPGEKYSDFNTNLNTLIKRLKNLALTFDGGRKIRIISPFQTNREGHKEAEKNDGIYRLSALSNANEAERSADLIISVYMSEEMRKNNLMKIGCMKHRRGNNFPAFDAHIDFNSKHIGELIQVVGSGMINFPIDEETIIGPV